MRKKGLKTSRAKRKESAKTAFPLVLVSGTFDQILHTLTEREEKRILHFSWATWPAACREKEKESKERYGFRFGRIELHALVANYDPSQWSPQSGATYSHFKCILVWCAFVLYQISRWGGNEASQRYAFTVLFYALATSWEAFVDFFTDQPLAFWLLLTSLGFDFFCPGSGSHHPSYRVCLLNCLAFPP